MIVGIAHTKRGEETDTLCAAFDAGVRICGDKPIHIQGRWEARNVDRCDCVIQFNGTALEHASSWTGNKGLRNLVTRRCWRARTRRLVVETGFLSNWQACQRGESSDVYWALGWDDIKSRAEYVLPDTIGGRLAKLGLDHPPERGGNPNGPVLVFGQVEGGYAETSFDPATDYAAVADAVRRKLAGRPVVFRMHPAFIKRRLTKYDIEAARVTDIMGPVEFDDGPLPELLSRCSAAVCWASNAAADVVLAGVPLVVLSPLSIAFNVAEHDLESIHSPRMPSLADRQQWLERVAWMQWNVREIADGTAWSVVRRVAQNPPLPPDEAFQ